MTSKTFSTAAVVSLSSGVLLCDFSKMHELAEHLMGHPIWTHQFASKTLWNRMRGKLLEQHPALPSTEPKGVGGENWQEYLADACVMFGEELPINGSPSTGDTDAND